MKRVKFTGKVNHKEIGELYMLADVFTFPSYTETQGLIFLEAQYFGLFVAAIDNEVNREFVNPENGKFVENDAKEFAKALQEIDFSKLSGKRKKARKWAEKFSNDKMAEKLAYYYEELIRKGTKKRWYAKSRITNLKEQLKNLGQMDSAL